MEYPLNHPWGLGLLLLLGLVAVNEIGRRIGGTPAKQQDETDKEQRVALRDALFVLLSLLLGFTLALAVPRYDTRRTLLIDEANAIGTTYLRAGTLPPPYRDRAERLLREYVDARLEFLDAGLDHPRFEAALARAKRVQSELWAIVLAVTQTERTPVVVAFMNSLNEVIDLDAKRVAAGENRIPQTLWVMILCVALLATFIRGMTQQRRFWLTLMLSPLTIALVVALIAELDTPRSGLIRVDHRTLLRLKADVQAPPGQ